MLFKPTEHPMLPLPGVEEMEGALGDEVKRAALFDFLKAREKRIGLAESDPYRYGFELEHWKNADELLSEIELVLFIFGGNRSGKSEYAAKRLVRSAVEHRDSIVMCLHESDESSIETQQKLVWKYLPPEIKALNDRRNSVYKVRYSQAGGFTEGKLVLPNRSEIHFVSYKQDPGAFEGWELGVKDAAELGCWADENMPLPWLRMLLFRLATRAGKLVWTFTPVNGMTPTIKDQVGKTPKTLASRAAELLPGRVNVPGLPEGEMPFVQVPLLEKSRVIYFFSAWNPFGKSYSQIKKLCAGKPTNFIEIRAYGYCRDSISRAFPMFGEVNVVEPEALPALGTNYMVTDPAGVRNWATIYARVTPGNPGDIYIYRDWPEVRRFGEWAVTAGNPNKFDGEPGPAQQGLGYGVPQYKQLWLREERIGEVLFTAETQRTRSTEGEDGTEGKRGEGEFRRDAEMGTRDACAPQIAPGRLVERDPYRARGVKLMREGGDLSEYGVEETENGAVVRERIYMRIVDRRAGRNQHVAEKGGTCIVDLFGETQREEQTGKVTGPGMHLTLASGVDIQEGVTRINELLWWETERPLCKGLNAPRLFVSRECQQVIWALQNWTGEDGEHGACKDFVDVIRYLALQEPRYVTAGMLRVRGGGGY